MSVSEHARARSCTLRQRQVRTSNPSYLNTDLRTAPQGIKRVCASAHAGLQVRTHTCVNTCRCCFLQGVVLAFASQVCTDAASGGHPEVGRRALAHSGRSQAGAPQQAVVDHVCAGARF